MTLSAMARSEVRALTCGLFYYVNFTCGRHYASATLSDGGMYSVCAGELKIIFAQAEVGLGSGCVCVQRIVGHGMTAKESREETEVDVALSHATHDVMQGGYCKGTRY